MQIEKGNYVLATKYSDGSGGDHWAVGLFSESDEDRYYLVDNEGNQLRRNGFRRCERINSDEGEYLLSLGDTDYMEIQMWETLYQYRIKVLEDELNEELRR